MSHTRGSAEAGMRSGISSPNVWSRLVSSPSLNAMPVAIAVTLFVTDQMWKVSSGVKPL